jgi:RNA polymerase sigma-70 factor, ECF subfamily
MINIYDRNSNGSLPGLVHPVMQGSKARSRASHVPWSAHRPKTPAHKTLPTFSAGILEEQVRQEQDCILVERCLRGDDRAWEAIVRLYGRRIFRLSLRYVRQKEEAEDMTQEIFIRAYQTLRSFRKEAGSLRSWFLRVGRNLIIDHHRHERRFKKTMGSEEMETLQLQDERVPNPLHAVEQDETSRIINRSLIMLAPEIMEAVIHRDLENMSYREIAQMAGVPEGTVKSRVSRGRLQLAKWLLQRKDQLPPIEGLNPGRNQNLISMQCFA